MPSINKRFIKLVNTKDSNNKNILDVLVKDKNGNIKGRIGHIFLNNKSRYNSSYSVELKYSNDRYYGNAIANSELGLKSDGILYYLIFKPKWICNQNEEDRIDDARLLVKSKILALLISCSAELGIGMCKDTDVALYNFIYGINYNEMLDQVDNPSDD